LEAYPFLLKGNEDLRQDERVMQLLQLVNTLLVAAHLQGFIQ
jgi:phosphatidylinositol kinase/protein kinase (PI-3  family)